MGGLCTRPQKNLATATTDQLAASGTAEPQPNFEIETWTDQEHAHWNKTGEIPASKAAESTPAEAAPEGETVTESAPVPAEAHPKGKGAEARKAELAREIQELLDRRKTVQKEWEEFETARKGGTAAKPAESAPAKPEAKPERPAKPSFGEAGHENETWDQFEARQDAYQESLTTFKVQEALEADRAAREKERKEAETAAANERITQAWEQRKEAAIAALGTTPEEFSKVALENEALLKHIKAGGAMDGFILDSDQGPRILHYLGTHMEEAQRIAALNPYRQVAELTKIELSFANGKAPVAPITKAARPGTDLKATSSPPPDPRRAAIERASANPDDPTAGVAEYFAEMNRRKG